MMLLSRVPFSSRRLKRLAAPRKGIPTLRPVGGGSAKALTEAAAQAVEGSCSLLRPMGQCGPRA